ncbi:MAG: nitroreductase family protein [Pseudomonadota bacterium]
MFSRESMNYKALPLPDRHSMNEREMLEAAGNFHKFMSKRHSVRDFSERPVGQEIIESCIKAAGSAPSGANHQPWHFVAVQNPDVKREIRLAAEREEKEFYAGGGGDEWISALEPIGTSWEKPHLETAPWLIVIFAQRYGEFDDGTRYKNYYVNESVGIATGFLLAAIHHAGLVALTHTPNPMKFLNGLLERPASEKPVMIVPVGHPTDDATVPAVAKLKKPIDEILTIL